jgi:putative hydrolase of the HAD superfamily
MYAATSAFPLGGNKQPAGAHARPLAMSRFSGFSYMHTCRVIPTFIQLIKWGIKLAIVTDAPRLKAWQRLNAMRLGHFFDVVVTFDDTLKRKPHRAPFENALKKLNLKPGECMMVGDWIDRDIEGAKKVGMKTCFARYGWQKALGGDPDKSGANYVIDKFDDILNIIQRENKGS